MDEVLKQLNIIRDIGERLYDLASTRAVPDNIVQKLKIEADSIKWAYTELRKQYVVDICGLIGHPAVLDICEKDQSNIKLVADNLAVTVLIGPDPIISERIIDFFSTKGSWDGNYLDRDKNPKWLRCYKYYGIECNPGERAALFKCLVLKHWLSDNGLKNVRHMISGWMLDIYKAMKWDEAQSV
jgi:hypothetical protein